MLDRYFHISKRGSTLGTELLAGATTFLTMAYIIFVQPAVLSGRFGQPTGMDFGAVLTATCLAAALASVIMGLYARYPIAQAPGMGQNFFFVATAIPAAAAAGHEQPWQVALGIVFLSGMLFLGMSLSGIRVWLFGAVSRSQQHAIAGGIGLFIALIGLRQCGLIVDNPGAGMRLTGRLASPDIAVFVVGLLAAVGLHVRRIPGAILWGIVIAMLTALALRGLFGTLPAERVSPWIADSQLMTRMAHFTGVMALPPSLEPTFLRFDVAAALAPRYWPLVLVFLFMLTFDTMGTLLAIGERAGLLRNGELGEARQALVSDAVGTVAGACLGTSTVVSFVESAAGVEAGGRTGLTAVVAGMLFLVAPWFAPLVALVGSYPPATAPALVLVGTMMCRSLASIDWDDLSEALPAFITLVGIPLCYSIADGLALGLVTYPAVKALGGRWREVPTISYGLAVVLLAYLLVLRA